MLREQFDEWLGAGVVPLDRGDRDERNTKHLGVPYLESRESPGPASSKNLYDSTLEVEVWAA